MFLNEHMGEMEHILPLHIFSFHIIRTGYIPSDLFVNSQRLFQASAPKALNSAK